MATVPLWQQGKAKATSRGRDRPPLPYPTRMQTSVAGGEHDPGIYHRSVFVDWRDYVGSYGLEQVNEQHSKNS